MLNQPHLYFSPQLHITLQVTSLHTGPLWAAFMYSNNTCLSNLWALIMFLYFYIIFYLLTTHNPPASEASREGASLTERKNPHIPVYGVNKFVLFSVCLSSVCLLQTLTPIISGLAKQNELKFTLTCPICRGSLKFATQISPLFN